LRAPLEAGMAFGALSTVAEGNPGFAEVVGGHFHIDSVTYADADEVFPHLAGDVRQDLVPVGEGHAKHRTR